jgi:hypothetical protein
LMLWWKQPVAGDLVWCYFPQDHRLQPGPKPRPGLVFKVLSVLGVAQQFAVQVIYGTSKKVDSLHSGEFLIADDEGEPYKLSGLSYSTKFALTKIVELPYNENWFSVPPEPRYGQTPKLGVLHPSLMPRLRSAREAIKKPATQE